MAYIKRLLEREYPDGVIPRYGSRNHEKLAQLLEDIRNRHYANNAPDREAYKQAVRRGNESVEQINSELFGE